jgi:HlyD family secretion protein
MSDLDELNRESVMKADLQTKSIIVEDYVSATPNFIARWGSLILILILFCIGLGCWFIRYPDLVTGRAHLTSIDAPKEVISRKGGKLEKLFVENNKDVRQGELLGYIESTSNPSSINKLKVSLDSILYYVTNGNDSMILDYFPNYYNQEYLKKLGELQRPFESFIQNFIVYRDFIGVRLYEKKRTMLKSDLLNLTRLHAALEEQKALMEQDLDLSRQTFKANESLARDNVISRLDYRNEQSKLLIKQLTIPQIKSAIISNESQQNDKNKEISELENQVLVERNKFIQALQSMISEVSQWEFLYGLYAPIDGRLQMASFFQENQYVKEGQLLFLIQPNSTKFFLEMYIPQYNFGNVANGQDVLIKLQAYPYEIYGSLQGKLEDINTVPTDSGYLAKVTLPNGLVTNYGKTLRYQYGLLAQADIITKDMRLIERFYFSVSRQLRR